MPKGEVFPAEWLSFSDPETGVEVPQLTNHKGCGHHLYFTNPGWYDGGLRILFGSDRNNRTNLYGVDQVLFASDASGNGNLHLVDMPDFEPLQGATDA